MTVARATLAVAVFTLAAVPAVAQFGGLFDPPRPPASVPARPDRQPNNPNPQLLPPGPPPARIQGEDLPAAGARPGAPPPRQGVAAIPPAALPSGAPPRPGGAPPAGGPGAAPTVAPAPSEDVVSQPPAVKITNPMAVFAGLDKITGRITAFDAKIGETVQFGALQVTARVCYSRPPTETPLTDGFVEVDEVTLQGEVRRIFTGWMFAASPGLHAVEHPIYDVWLTDCKGGAPAAAVAEVAPAPAAAPSGRSNSPQQRQPRQAAPRQPTPPPPGGTLLGR